MIIGYLVTFIVLAFFIFFIMTKRDMLTKMGLMVNAPAKNKFQEELEKTGEEIIKRLEYQVAQLEFLVEEADQKIKLLDSRLQQAEVSFDRAGSPVTETQINNFNSYDHVIDTYRQAMSSSQEDTVFTEKPEATINSDKKSLILAMAEQGYTTTEIARATGLGKGEVALVLQFNKK